MGPHGTYEQALTWALDHALGTDCEDFLRAWREGDIEQYPAYREWLASQPETLDSPAHCCFRHPRTQREDCEAAELALVLIRTNRLSETQALSTVIELIDRARPAFVAGEIDAARADDQVPF